jgi:hypothetical protein
MKLNLESDINNDEVLKKKKPWYMGPWEEDSSSTASPLDPN